MSDSSDKQFDVLNSYQTTDYCKSQTIDSNGSGFADNYDIVCNKIDLHSIDSQMKESQCWPESEPRLSARSSLVGQPTGPAVGPLVSPSGALIEHSVPQQISPMSSRSSAADPLWQSLSGYCPKIVEHNSADFDRFYSPGVSQTNDYQFASTNQTNFSAIIDKLMQSQNQLLKEKTLEELRKEGIEMKENFNLEIYMCKVCDEVFQTSDSALIHSRSTEHSEKKLGIFPDDLDRSLIIPSENLSDINVVLARKQELKKLDIKTKYEFRRHGIRIKDGIGVNAYVCLECKVSFMSYNYVRSHLAKFNAPEQSSDVVYSSNTFYPGLIPRKDFAPAFSQSSSLSKNMSAQSSKTGESRTRKRRKRRNRRRQRELMERDGSPDYKRERADDDSPRDYRSGQRDFGDLEDIDLKKEGIREKELRNKGLKYVCQLCDRLLTDRSEAIAHVTSNEHIGAKTGEMLRGVERLFVTDCYQKPIDYFLARKRQLRAVSFDDMEQFVYHGIRLKNGMGSEAFICLTCDQALADLQTIAHHIKFLDAHRNIEMADMCGQSEAVAHMSKLSPLDMEALFSNEGIKHEINYTENKRSERFVCVFCDAHFKTIESVIFHLSRPYHRKTKRSEVLRPIDAYFVIPSQRSDVFDVAYARIKAIHSFTNEQKIRFSEEGIRLEDGYGSDAYRCVKCGLSIAAESHHSAVTQINKHIDSRQHIERLSA